MYGCWKMTNHAKWLRGRTNWIIFIDCWYSIAREQFTQQPIKWFGRKEGEIFRMPIWHRNVSSIAQSQRAKRLITSAKNLLVLGISNGGPSTICYRRKSPTIRTLFAHYLCIWSCTQIFVKNGHILMSGFPFCSLHW